MGRWEADAQGRMMAAAIALFREHGFEQTTVAEIAERAGVTERTFFRYFSDKREVLFDRTDSLQNTTVREIADAPQGSDPLDVASEALMRAAAVLEDNRDYSRLRGSIIASDHGLQERELLKLARLGAAATLALQDRGVPAVAASLAAQSAVTVFHVGFQNWVADGETRSLTECMRDALAELRSLAR